MLVLVRSWPLLGVFGWEVVVFVVLVCCLVVLVLLVGAGGVWRCCFGLLVFDLLPGLLLVAGVVVGCRVGG